MELVQRCAVELGMTPSSRSRVETVRRPIDNPDKLLAYPPSRSSDTFPTDATPSEFD
jgi:hypothetical protein